ncbi:hypothetical protein WN943_014963 [Citrus x changshan-huyou]|uniref:Uncharacterized protein n=1 Tax=Citrus unshiu TaxID=55188 RepID=A0A2H5MV31_CITUN|nr:hypothetical protein CUMW_272650 [Citrus unshiu]
MAMGTMYATVPAFAAAFSIYLLDRSHSKVQEFKGFAPASIASVLAKPNMDVENVQLPKLAPQFDGLHSFETLVAH